MYRNAIYICISWYSKIFWFSVNNADVSRTQGVYYMIHIFFGSSLDKVKLSNSSLQDMCDRFLGKGPFLPSAIREQPR